MKKRLLTGIQSSGTLHIGNYFGALKPFVDCYEEYDSHLMIADLHAITTVREPNLLRQNIIDVVKDYIAAGVNPEKAIIFQQSNIQEHAELAWMFECLVTVPFLMQAHAYKDKVAKGIEATAGLFNYPMLMAADILLYDADVVPVGEDQRQHIEYAREAATKFNNAYGQTFTPPQEMILKAVGIVPGTDGQKMSKSYKNTIPLFGTKDEIHKAVMGIVTDSITREEAAKSSQETEEVVLREVPFAKNLFAIHQLFKKDYDALFDFYMENENNYKGLKISLIDAIEEFIAPMRERRAAISDNDVKNLLENGASRARVQAVKKMAEVREKVGLSI